MFKTHIFAIHGFLQFKAVPGYAHLPASKLLHRELFIAPAEALYRDTAPAASTQFLHRELILAARKFVPRLRQSGKIIYRRLQKRMLIIQLPNLDKMILIFMKNLVVGSMI